MADIVLRVQGLTKAFGPRRVVDQVSFEVERATFVTILGPSGSGKTTTLRLVAGFETPTDGEILLNGERINEKAPFERDVNTVFQHYALFPHMNVFDNVAFGLRCAGRLDAREIRGKVLEALDLVRLVGTEGRSVRSLSGGEQQRVALARTFVNAPSLLLLDEPLGALDLKLRRQMQVELKSLQQRLQMTFLYVTHDQEEALGMSDRVIVMHRGRIEQSGSPTELFYAPRTTFVADFIGESNILTGTLLDPDRGAARISLNGFPCFVQSPQGPPGGRDPVHLSIRAENFALQQEAEGKRNRIQGTVEQSIFYGTLSELMILLENGQRIRVKKPLKATREPFRPGDRVLVGWDPEDAVIVSEE